MNRQPETGQAKPPDANRLGIVEDYRLLIETIRDYAILMLDPNGIRNLKPAPGEPAALPDQPARGFGVMALTHALISRVPAMNGSGRW